MHFDYDSDEGDEEYKEDMRTFKSIDRGEGPSDPIKVREVFVEPSRDHQDTWRVASVERPGFVQIQYYGRELDIVYDKPNNRWIAVKRLKGIFRGAIRPTQHPFRVFLRLRDATPPTYEPVFKYYGSDPDIRIGTQFVETELGKTGDRWVVIDENVRTAEIKNKKTGEILEIGYSGNDRGLWFILLPRTRSRDYPYIKSPAAFDQKHRDRAFSLLQDVEAPLVDSSRGPTIPIELGDIFVKSEEGRYGEKWTAVKIPTDYSIYVSNGEEEVHLWYTANYLGEWRHVGYHLLPQELFRPLLEFPPLLVEVPAPPTQ